jgi:hypothetical protein
MVGQWKGCPWKWKLDRAVVKIPADVSRSNALLSVVFLMYFNRRTTI